MSIAFKRMEDEERECPRRRRAINGTSSLFLLLFGARVFNSGEKSVDVVQTQPAGSAAEPRCKLMRGAQLSELQFGETGVTRTMEMSQPNSAIKRAMGY